MATAANPGAVSIGEAAKRLHVTRQRVSQLLNEGRLEGPSTPVGGAAANAPRVSVASLDAEIERRRAAGPRSKRPRVDLANLGGTGISVTNAAVLHELRELRRVADRSQRREDAARAALVSVKAAAEVARADAAKSRRRAARLARLLRDTAIALADELDGDFDAMASAYSDALTQLAAPGDAEMLDDQYQAAGDAD